MQPSSMFHAKYLNLKKRFSKDLEHNLVIYWHSGYLGLVTKTIYTNICSHFPSRRHINMVLISQKVCEKKIVENGSQTTDKVFYESISLIVSIVLTSGTHR